jgi:hypothetical protein
VMFDGLLGGSRRTGKRACKGHGYGGAEQRHGRSLLLLGGLAWLGEKRRPRAMPQGQGPEKSRKT